MKEKYFIKKENEAVIMTDEGRKAFYQLGNQKNKKVLSIHS